MLDCELDTARPNGEKPAIEGLIIESNWKLQVKDAAGDAAGSAKDAAGNAKVKILPALVFRISCIYPLW